MTPREKRIVDRFRKQNPKSMRHDSDQELLDYLKAVKKQFPHINFDKWVRS